ncbi:MAG: hypothetical protein R3F19_28365 [Verrucomicrobiales bacterium]
MVVMQGRTWLVANDRSAHAYFRIHGYSNGSAECGADFTRFFNLNGKMGSIFAVIGAFQKAKGAYSAHHARSVDAALRKRMFKVFIKTYGCQMNERDSEQVSQMFLDKRELCRDLRGVGCRRDF